MNTEDFEQTHFTYASILMSYATFGALKKGKWINGHMIKLGLKLIDFIEITLLEMYPKSSSIVYAKNAFGKLVK